MSAAESAAGAADTTARPVRTILTMQVREGSEGAFEAAWARAAAVIAGVPGQLRQQLMRDARDPRSYSIVSDWTDRDSVDAFGRSSARETLTEALRDMREGASRATYSLLATVDADLGAQDRAHEEARQETQPSAGGGAPPVRVSFSTPVVDGEQEDFERGYETMAENVTGKGGHVREELLYDPVELRYYIFAEWTSEDAFTSWVGDPSHMADGAPLARWHAVEFRRETLEIRQRPRTGAGAFAVVPAVGVPAAGTADPGSRVRVDVAFDVAPGEQAAFERAYLDLADLAAGAPGHVLEELLCESGGSRYHVLAEWESLADFERWADGPGHLVGGPLGRWLGDGHDRRVFVLRRRTAHGIDGIVVEGAVADAVVAHGAAVPA